MRIFHIVHQYVPEHVGGTELYTQTLAQHQIATGHSVAVFYPSIADENPSETAIIDERGVRLYGVPMGRRSRSQVFLDTFAKKKLTTHFKTILAAENPDIIHIQHLMGLPIGLVNQIIAAHIPYVVTLHDYWYGCANGQLITNTDNTLCTGPDKLYLNCGRCALARAGQAGKTWFSPGIAPLMAYRNGRLRHILRHAQAVIPPTRFVQNTYQGMGFSIDNFHHVPHGIELPQQKIKAVLAKKAAAPARDGLHIGYIGSLGWQKGIHVLIAAVNQLPTENVTLTIYGSLDTFPDYVTQLRQMVRHPGITFAGRVSRDDVWAAIAECDVMVMPTLWYEASPLTIDEVFAVQVPLIASRVGALPEKIEDRVNGRFFPPGDSATLAQILLEYYQDKSHLHHLKAGIKPVRTIKKHLQDIETIYTQIIQ